MDELIHYYSVDVSVVFDIDLDSDQIDTELTSDIHDTFVEELQDAFKNNPDVDLDDCDWGWDKDHDYIQYLYISSKLDKAAVTPIVENILDSIVSFERTDELWDGTYYYERHGLDTPPYERVASTRDYTYKVDVDTDILRFFETNEDGEVLQEAVTKNELKDRANKHAKKQNGLSPFCSLSESSNSENCLWKLIKSDKWYDPEGLGIEDPEDVVFQGTEEECRSEFNNLVVHFKNKERRENSPQLAKVYIYFIRVSVPNNNTLIVEYPQAKAKDIYQLVKCDDFITESVPKSNIRKKKKPYDSIKTDAGNVEYNIGMFNKMSGATEGPVTNPVSGPFGGDVSSGCCESLDDIEKDETVFMEEYDFTNVNTTYTKEVGMNDYFESMNKEDNE